MDHQDQQVIQDILEVEEVVDQTLIHHIQELQLKEQVVEEMVVFQDTQVNQEMLVVDKLEQQQQLILVVVAVAQVMDQLL
jgi:hypothetical protein